ncbi:MAG: hypothetical protein QOJ45_425 [Verrucomicrobiota bacterium]
MPTDPNLVKLIWIFTAILLPVIPAILLFKILPASTTDVSGPFKGLQVKLGGAVGIYFLLVLIISFGPKPTPPSPSEVWRVKGYVQDENGETLAADKVNMNIQPNTVEYRNDGSFKMDVLVKRNDMGTVDMPILNVLWQPAQSFGNATIHLDPTDRTGKIYKLETNQAAHEIVIVEPIKLGKRIAEAPYQPPTNVTPQPTSLPSALVTPTPSPTTTPKT